MRLYSSYAYTSAFTKIKILVKASICPSGTGGNWVLPLSGTANNNVSGSFYNLLNQYNATSGTSGATTIVQLPLAFVRSGVIYPSNGTAGYVGNSGLWWARTAKSSTLAYDLGMNPSNVNSESDNNYRYHGFSLRCLCLALKSGDNLRHPYLSD